MALDLSALDGLGSEEEQVKPASVAPKAPLAQFEEDPENPRFEFDDPEFADFVEDIRTRGILQPLVVRQMESGKLRIRFGARRYRAARVIGLAEVPYVITEDARQFDDYSQVSENQRRKNLTPLELARFIAKRIEAKDKKTKIAEHLRIDASAITHLLALVNPPAFLMELYQSGKCRSPSYLYELRKLHEKNAEIVERRCAEADEITRRLIIAIDAEINPPAIPPSSSTSVKDALDNPNAGSGGQPGGNSGSNESETKEAGTSAETHQIPPHNPEIEKDKGSKPTDPDKIKKPLLLGSYEGRDVMVLLNQRPSAPGLIIVRYEDGSGDEEVQIGTVTLTMLTESTA